MAMIVCPNLIFCLKWPCEHQEGALSQVDHGMKCVYSQASLDLESQSHLISSSDSQFTLCHGVKSATESRYFIIFVTVTRYFSLIMVWESLKVSL